MSSWCDSKICLSLQLSQQLDSLLGMLCADVAPADGASIQQNLKLLEEKLQTVGLYSSKSFLPIFLQKFLYVIIVSHLLQCRSRSYFPASEGGSGAGADVQPAVMVSGGNGESSWRTAGQRSAHSGCDGGNAAPQAEVRLFSSDLSCICLVKRTCCGKVTLLC